MSRDLTNLFIDETFQYLLQKSGSEVQNGLGVRQDFLDVSASYALTAETVTGTVTNALYAQNTITTGKNLEATEILKGTPLYFTGSGTNGNLVGIFRADAGNPDRMPAGGVAGEDIATEAEGLVLLDGYIGGVDTSLFASGDEVFVGVGGGYTNVAPTGSSNLIQHLGNVEKSHPSNGSGVIQMMGEPRGLPNIQEGHLWVGDVNDVPQAIPTSSIAGDSFPYTGSAGISGSLAVQGPISSETFGTISLTGDSPGINRNILDFTGADFSVIRTDAGLNIDNRAGTGSISVFTNGNMQFEPQGDLDFYTPTGRINLTAADGNLTTTAGDLNVTAQGKVRISSDDEIVQQVGSVLARVYQNGAQFSKFQSGSISMNFNAFNGESQPSIFFDGVNSYFQANNNMVFENAPGGVGTGNMQFVSNGNIDFISNLKDIRFQVTGSQNIDIQGPAFAYSISSNINGFSNQVDEYTRVRDNQRAFVETPLIIGGLGTIEVGTNSTLKVINEL